MFILILFQHLLHKTESDEVLEVIDQVKAQIEENWIGAPVAEKKKAKKAKGRKRKWGKKHKKIETFYFSEILSKRLLDLWLEVE